MHNHKLKSSSVKDLAFFQVEIFMNLTDTQWNMDQNVSGKRSAGHLNSLFNKFLFKYSKYIKIHCKILVMWQK